MIDIKDYLNKIIHGNALDVLQEIPDKSVNSIISSPPYYLKRRYEGIPDYIWDGDKNCDHNWIEQNSIKMTGGKNGIAPEYNEKRHFEPDVNICSKCGAMKCQLGNESNKDDYLNHLLQIISECKRILKDDGTMFINLDDTWMTNSSFSVEGRQGFNKKDGMIYKSDKKIKQKSLMAIPQRFLIACIDDLGLICRNDIHWVKKNSMPFSGIDRFTHNYENIFFFTKNEKYHFDLDAIRDVPKTKNTLRNKGADNYGKHLGLSNNLRNTNNEAGKNPGDVIEFWDDYRKLPLDKYLEMCKEYYYDEGDILNIPTKGNNEEHYAAYSENLLKKLILAGTPKDGIILDPFAGIASTVKAAIKFGRNGIGIEGSSKYIEIANKQLTEIRNIKENSKKFI